ncbi:MAG TPA: DUF2846 domain-containing protein [Xanthobacteraceae bacterium]|nr:DUF2846 domain-containing protein [Xanthobacteraceae bacterium]
MTISEGVRGARASWRWFAAFVVAAALGGCATDSGTPISSLATVGGLHAGMARIVVVRQEPRSYGMRNGNFPVKLDGQPLGELSPGTFAYADCPAGSHQLSADFAGYPGVTRRDFTAAPGRTYYFRASLNEKVDNITAVTMISPLGGLIAASATYNDRQGPIDLTPITASEAKQAMPAVAAAAH